VRKDRKENRKTDSGLNHRIRLTISSLFESLGWPKNREVIVSHIQKVDPIFLLAVISTAAAIIFLEATVNENIGYMIGAVIVVSLRNRKRPIELQPDAK
jgi:hypothetical protein